MRLIMCLFLASSMCAQTAKVIPLDKQDTDLVKALNTQLNNITKQLNEVNSKIRDKYLLTTDANLCWSNKRVGVDSDADLNWITSDLSVDKNSRDAYAYNKAHPLLYYKAGWCCGQFQYSDDYKYIVPLVTESSKPYNGLVAATN